MLGWFLYNMKEQVTNIKDQSSFLIACLEITNEFVKYSSLNIEFKYIF